MSKPGKRRYVEGGAMSDQKIIKISRMAGRDDLFDKRDDFDTTAKDEIGEQVQKEEYENKHTMESDEEEEEKYKRLDMDKVEGQEEATIDHEGQVKITPFNMKEEMEEGHFDSMGTFIYNKDKGDIADAWLDNIDWSHVKKNAGDQWQEESKIKSEGDDGNDDGDDGNDDDDSLPVKSIDKVAIYKQIVLLLKPKETITKALKRLGGNLTAQDERKRRWAAKKAEKDKAKVKQDGTLCEEVDPSTSTDQVSDVTTLTSLVDQLVANGQFEAYGYTLEKLNFELERMTKVQNPDVDMFSEITASTSNQDSAQMSELNSTAKPEMATNVNNSTVMWEFKWKNDDNAEIHGPHTSEQMLEWQEQDYFKDGVFVRKVNFENPDAQFYSSRRIDFDLYI